MIVSRTLQMLVASLTVLTVASGSLQAEETPPPPIKVVDAFAEGEPPLPEEGSFTVIVLPDTQNYSEKFPEIFKNQTKWIVDQKEKRNIVFALQLGDVTNFNSRPEWVNAVAAMSLLDGVVPYAICPGNHDFSDRGRSVDRTTLLNDYFPLSKYSGLETFGGTYDKEPDQMQNTYHLFSAGGKDFLVLSLEFGPRADVVRWANEIAEKHKDRQAILITHAYMYADGLRYNWDKYGNKQFWNPKAYGIMKSENGDVADGEDLWNQLVSKNENFIMTFNGHVLHSGLSKLTSQTPAGRDVHQMLVNFQTKPNGGNGWLRILEFKADGKTVEAYDYSPYLNQRNESDQNRFTLEISDALVEQPAQ